MQEQLALDVVRVTKGRNTSGPLALGGLLRKTHLRALNDHLPLEFRKDAQKLDHHATGCCGRVERL
ncbi:MAG: hypothetical protein ABIS18_03890 [Actinomycetota bacterium]